jgi:hypothetical protein
LGRFEIYSPADEMKGVVIGAPHGAAETGAVEYAKWLQKRTGAGLVVAYGIGGRRLPVVRPLVVSSTPIPTSEDPLRRGSIYREFKQVLEQTGGGTVKFYIGLRSAPAGSRPESIEVATSGFGVEQLRALKEFFERARDRKVYDGSLPRVPLALEPLDKISWQVSGIKHHGMLMSAERGLNIRLPQSIAAEPAKTVYREILHDWITLALAVAQNAFPSIRHVDVAVLDHGRIESVPVGTGRKGVVVAAPHGTFDEHTADLVRRISYRTGMAAVITGGFTPTETAGWRINVNRPSERHYPGGEIEIGSARSRTVYEKFRDAVFAVADGDLELYVDIHQNGSQAAIEVATVGISAEQARAIKKSFSEISQVALKGLAPLPTVEFRIEPLDRIQIGAWAAKAGGILSIAKKSLHFELPLQETLCTAEGRNAYAVILSRLVVRVAELLVDRPNEAMDVAAR